jgi:hypothetical protein
MTVAEKYSKVSQKSIFRFVTQTDISLLLAAIRQSYKCGAAHLETVQVEEQSGGKSVWKGDVGVFEVQGHPKATRCFAWLQAEDGKGIRPVTLLHKWPIVSPETAVKATIALGHFRIRAVDIVFSAGLTSQSLGSTPRTL